MKNMPHCELPQEWTMRDELASLIEFAREAMSLRVGYEVEVAGLETMDREGHANLRVYWRPLSREQFVISKR